MNLTAAQHVSGILTGSQSNRRQAGFQTICKSKDLLTPDEVRILESQVQSTSLHEVAKWQSYRLSPQRHVICRIVPIAAPDEFGRPGRFFAHSLVFDVTDPDFDDLVFSLIDERHFFNTLDAVIANDVSGSGHINSITLKADTRWIDQANRLAETWAGDELDRLFVLMAHTSRISEQGQFVNVVGSETEILEALKVSALVTPSDLRHLCSFDTHAERDPRSLIKFWGRGCLVANSGSYIISGAHQTVTSPLPLFSYEGFSLDKLSPPLREAVAANLKRTQERVSGRDLYNRSYPEFLANEVYEALCSRPELSLPEGDLQCLVPLREAHLKLATLVAIRSGDQSLKLKLFRQLNNLSYKTLINDLTRHGRFNPAEFFSTRFIPLWIEVLGKHITLDTAWLGLETVEKYGAKDDRKEIGLITKYLNREQLQILEHRLQQSPLRFKELDKAIRTNRKAEQKGSSVSSLRTWFHRLPGLRSK